MAGWSELSNAWLDVTCCDWQLGGHRVYWNGVTFVAEQPATVAQKENPGNTVDWISTTPFTWVLQAALLCYSFYSVVLSPRGFFTVSVSHLCLWTDNFVMVVSLCLFHSFIMEILWKFKRNCLLLIKYTET